MQDSRPPNDLFGRCLIDVDSTCSSESSGDQYAHNCIELNSFAYLANACCFDRVTDIPPARECVKSLASRIQPSGSCSTRILLTTAPDLSFSSKTWMLTLKCGSLPVRHTTLERSFEQSSDSPFSEYGANRGPDPRTAFH